MWMTGFEAARLGLEAQTVIGLRIMGLAGLWAMPSSENLRMVSEKQAAFAAAAMAVGTALARGATATTVARRAMTPVRARTSANVRRLSRAAGGGS